MPRPGSERTGRQRLLTGQSRLAEEDEGTLSNCAFMNLILVITHLLGQVVLQTDRLDQAELRFQPVDVFFRFDEDRLEQLAACRRP